MPGFLGALLPLALGGLSALGGSRKRRTSTVADTSSTTSQSGTFNNTTTSGVSPEFGGVLQDIIQRITSSASRPNFDPSQLDIIGNTLKAGVNNRAGNLFSNLTATNAARGLGDSPSANQAALAFSENLRSSGLNDVSGNIAQQKFQLPLLQQQLDTQRNAGLLQLLGLLPRTSIQSGTSSSTGTSTGTTTQTGTSGGQLGNIIGGGIAGGVAGLDIAKRLGLQTPFGDIGGNDSAPVPFTNPNLFNPPPVSTNFGITNPDLFDVNQRTSLPPNLRNVFAAA